LNESAQTFIHVFLEGVLHIEFFLGAYLWFYCCFSHCFGDGSSQLDKTSSWNIACSHTLAFSIGVFVVKDFNLRFKSQKNYDPTKYYTLCAVGILAIRVISQMVHQYYQLADPDDVVTVGMIAIFMFTLLPTRSAGYLFLPFLVFAISTSTAIAGTLLTYLNYYGNDLFPTFCVIIGIVFGHYWNKPNEPKLTALNSIQDLPMNGSRMKRASNFPPAMPNGWYRMIGSEDVKPGQVQQVLALNRQFVVFRGNENKKITISDAFCPHLGANLAIGGIVRGNDLVCPFHEWQFDSNGKCTKIPMADKIPDAAKLKVWTSLEYMGSVYLWFDAEGREPTYYPPKVDLFDRGKLKFYGEKKQSMYLHVQDVAENSSDLAHFSVIHKSLHVPVLNLFTYISHSISTEKFPDQPHLLKFVNRALIYSVFNEEKPLLPDNVHTEVLIVGPSTIMYFQVYTPLGMVMIVKTFLVHRY
jgi:nitrite reductase/ring-hydroxylating ferredoxin subunit